MSDGWLSRSLGRLAGAIVPGPSSDAAESSRFEFVDGAYRRTDRLEGAAGDVTLSVVGDLVCGPMMQRAAAVGGVDDVSACFSDELRGILTSADLVVGGLASAAPRAFLSAVRAAGIDGLLTVPEAIADAGDDAFATTLDAVTRAGLVHGAARTGRSGAGTMLFVIRGITVAVVSCHGSGGWDDGPESSAAVRPGASTSSFAGSSFAQDVADARAAGAEFVLAHIRWGGGRTEEITDAQAEFACQVADAGADYVVGADAGLPQVYTVVRARDGRRVPVLHSAGSLLTEAPGEVPDLSDSVIVSLTLTRDDDGRVVLAEDGYRPCRIVDDDAVRGGRRAVPVRALADGRYGASTVVAAQTARRTARVLGRQYRCLDADPLAFGADLLGRPGPSTGSSISAPADEHGPYDPADDELVDAYSIREPGFAVVAGDTVQPSQGYEFDARSGTWRRAEASARGEAVLLCGGTLHYDRAMERYGRHGRDYDFRPLFRHLRTALSTADLAVGALGTIAAGMFPEMSKTPRRARGGHYANARPEFLRAVRDAGFDCLALAQPFVLDAGVRGAVTTERAVRESELVPSGLGREKLPVFDVNGIRIAVLSASVEVHGIRTTITEEGADRLLNVFDEEAMRADAARAREAGAQFVLGYLDCRTAGPPLKQSGRLAAGRRMADAGVDYVVCTGPHAVSRYEAHTTPDGRSVPIASGIGALSAGPDVFPEVPGAMLRIVVRSTPGGGVDLTDSAIPMQRFEAYHGASHATVPAHPFYVPEFRPEDFGEKPTTVARRLGTDLAIDRSRRLRIDSHHRLQVTPAQISERLGVGFSAEARERLGEDYDRPVHSIVGRRTDLHDGCAAIVTQTTPVDDTTVCPTSAEAVQSGATMAISERPCDDLPTLVVDAPWEAYASLVASIRTDYSPVTVGVTGTVGKTTSKDMLTRVFEGHCRTLYVRGNYNSLATAGLVAQKLAPDDEAYVQEINGGSPGSASAISRMVQPDICLITSIGEAHLKQMGSIENIIEGKMQIIDGMRDGGTLVICNDNEYLRKQRPPVRTLRYSAEDPDCDFFAKDIRRTGDSLEFDIVCADGVYPAIVHSRGVHNVQNALGVFAVARTAGVPASTIIAGISRHRASSTRQNLLEVGGYRLLLDAYNSNPVSLTSAFETLCEMSPEPGGRRIAVLGDMGDQGAKSTENHRAMGEVISGMPVDIVLCSGPGMLNTAEVLHAAGRPVLHAHDMTQLVIDARDVLRPGDAVLFKAGMSVNLMRNVVEPLFGMIA